VRHPRALMDPLECDLVFGRLRALPSKHAQDRALVEHEIAALWRWDVPLFGAGAETTTLTCDHQLPVATTLALSPLDNAVERVLGLSPENRDQQTAYVAASLAADPDDAAFRTACLDHAEQIGARLCRMQREPDAPAPWQSYRLTGDGAIVIDIEAELYNGSAGVALFLAHLDRARPDATLRATAQRALEHALSARDRSRMGAFGGTAGAIYVLTHLAHLWQDTALLDTATGLADELAQQLPSDRHFDVLNGAAGAIVVLLGLHRATGSGLDLAHGCAAHLLQHAVSDGDVLSWPLFTPEEASANLTGLAHGAGGIGWALTELGAATGRSEYVDAGRAAFRYEARHFDGTARDWYDLRRNPAPADRDGKHFANAWCNGAAGVGLTRLAAWDATGRTDDGLLHEARIALTATVRGFVRLRNDTLCHGRSGNAELMLRFAEVCGEPAWRLEANVAVRSQWRSVDDAGSGFGDAGSSFFPGLMLGISGFGLHYLRLADPDRVPSVLLLDPPRSATGKAEACP
jgi:type 2 lantibiotic biosynthesis protein LanM